MKRLARGLGVEIQRVEPPPSRLLFAESLPHEPDGLKEFANRTAGLLSDVGIEAVRGFYLTGVLGSGDQSVYTPIEIGGPETKQIGPWVRGAGPSGVFVRERNRGDEFSWSSKPVIQPKRGKWRVVLLGESAARGYLYDPQFNLADVLEGMLRAHLGKDAIDVVDLAKSNQTQQELKILIGQSLALRPDILVIFAGNNWRTHVSDADIPTVHGLLLQGGVPAMKAFLEQQRGAAALRLTEQINALVAPRQIGIVWVVPEFNLGDWADPALGAPLLPTAKAREWRSLSRRADHAQQAEDFVSAENLAAKMTELDGSTSSVPLRILAECNRRGGDLATTRHYLEGCRDAGGWNPGFSHSPRASSIVQSALRQASAFARNRVVDLPEVFKVHLAGAIPDRRLFLDYCHLSAEGIHVAMAAAASEIIGLLTDRVVSPEKMQSVAKAPTADVEGKASFLAAVHNAHFYQSSEVVQYWCDRACATWPDVSEVMVRFVETQTRRAPTFANRSLLEIAESDKLDMLRYLLRGGEQRADLILSEAVARAVASIKPNFAKEIADLRIVEHAPRSQPRQLISFYYNSSVPSPTESRWTTSCLPTNHGSRNVYSSAFAAASKFIFFGERDRLYRLRVTCRVPGVKSPVRVGIAVNGSAIGERMIGSQWLTIELEVPYSLPTNGLNEVVLTWPEDDDSEEAQLERAAEMIAKCQLPYFHRVYAEIHSLTVASADQQDRHLK